MFSQLRQLRLSLGLVALILGFQVHAFNAGRDVPPELKGKRSYVKRDGVDYTVFEHDATGATIDFVTNSGICETTPGVNQYSGYVSVGSKFNPVQFVPIPPLIPVQRIRACGSGFSKQDITPRPLLWHCGSMAVRAAPQ